MGSVMKCGGNCCYDKNKQQFVEELRHERELTWGRRVLASALPTWGSMPQAGNT